MKPTDVILDSKQITNSATASALLLEVRKGMTYEDGHATDKIDHYKYDVVLPENKYDKITVKIKGNALVTNEQIAQAGGQIKVKFRNLTGKFYGMSNGKYGFTANADGLEVIA